MILFVRLFYKKKKIINTVFKGGVPNVDFAPGINFSLHDPGSQENRIKQI